MPIHIFDIFNIFDIFEISPGSSGGSVLPVFQANVPNQDTGLMDDVAIGVGGLTELRDGSLWVEDYQGVSQEFGIGEVARSGGRVAGAVGARQVSWKDENGDPLPQLPRIVHAPEAANLYYSDSDLDQLFDTTAWITVSHYTLLGMPCSVINMNAIGAAAGVLCSGIHQDALVDDVPYTESFLISGVSGDLFVQFAVDQTTSSVINVDPRTGEYNIIEGTLIDAAGVVEESQGVFRVAITRTRSGGLYKTRIYIVSSLDSPRGDKVGGSEPFQMYIGQMNCIAGTEASYPIQTDGSAVTRPTCALSFDSANHDDVESTYYIEATTTGDCMIFGGFVSQVGSTIELSDGTNVTSVPAAPGEHKIGIVCGDGTMKLNVDSVWSAEVPYDGTLLQGALDLFRGSDVVGYAGVIERYATKDESIIDGLMA